MAEFTRLDELLLVVYPLNPHKEEKMLLKSRDRLHLARIAVEGYSKIKVSDIEFELPKPSYTIDTLIYLQEKFPGKKFELILGSDNLEHFHKWKNHEIILERYRLLIYPRGPLPEKYRNHPSVELVPAPQIEISSTQIREGIAAGKNMKFFLPPGVWDYIDAMHYYRQKQSGK
jgi:nicotinate-nucleotide adenylyltransferase